ncbi:glycosyltransferase 87 family protein [Allokutzneria albata]|uniref:Alpha-1,2-mannosyltransferase n=3 Tax=Allokutzneria albata TaxID=211114 RepID=A0A1H0DA68_ALLAB|nr:glycosyltransferase 87 family protein [Allokutzneria albata]SDN66998.1 alpha-1,2-mannosyltransferase [Allokutzneria albata]
MGAVAPSRRTLISIAALAALTFALALLVTSWVSFIDLRVYREGGDAVLRGLNLYSGDFPYSDTKFRLPFTYPPFAAVLFGPLATLSWSAAVVATLLVGSAALIATTSITARGFHPNWASAVRVGAGFAAVCVLAEPIRATLGYGQINLVLMLLVVADCLLPRTPWPRGLLIGIAAAIKLTPASFLLFFLVRMQWKPILSAMAGFAAAGGIGWLVAPEDSLKYWTTLLLEPGRIGSAAFADNQSLRGALMRFGLTEADASRWWMVIVPVVVAGAGFACWRLRAAGRDLPALLVVAAAGLICSPVSWTHHWVWIAPATVGAVIAIRRSSRPRPLIALAAVPLTLFFVGAHLLLRRGGELELQWTWPEHLLGNAYLITAFAVVIAGVVFGIRRRSPQPDLPHG